jgi:hypothetical protein
MKIFTVLVGMTLALAGLRVQNQVDHLQVASLKSLSPPSVVWTLAPTVECSF